MEHVAANHPGGCFVCAAVRDADDERHRVVDRGERCLTLLNAFPYASGHLLIAPMRHVAAFEELEAIERHELTDLADRAVRALKAAMAPDGFNIGLNLGAAAGAGLPGHLHLHVVPRWSGDTNFMAVIADTRVLPQALQATYDVVVGALAHLD
jgi:ATP adenylyltransferase